MRAAARNRTPKPLREFQKKRSANIDLHSGPLIASSRTLGPRAYKRPVVEQGALEALNPVWGLAGLKVCLALLTAKDSLKP